MSKAKILIVEDETLIALSLSKDLKRFGYEVSGRVTNFDDAIKSVQHNEPDLILMDINLGKGNKDGIDTAAEIKSIKNIPIIFVTAYSDKDTLLKIKQYKINPIGYLTKPYKKDELESQIFLAVYKIEENDIPEDIDFDQPAQLEELGCGYFFDIQSETLSYKEIPIQLSIKERKLLRLLIEARGNIVGQRDIEYVIWPDAPVSDSTLRNLIYRLRGKLEHELIETIPSLGIKLNINK